MAPGFKLNYDMAVPYGPSSLLWSGNTAEIQNGACCPSELKSSDEFMRRRQSHLRRYAFYLLLRIDFRVKFGTMLRRNLPICRTNAFLASAEETVARSLTLRARYRWYIREVNSNRV